MPTVLDLRPALRARTAADKSLNQPRHTLTELPSVTVRKQYGWWCEVHRRYDPDRPLDGWWALYNLEHDIASQLRSAIENAGQSRRGRHAIRTLAYMMGRRYMPGIGALIDNVPEVLRQTVEFECAEFQRTFLRKLDAVFKWRVIDRDTVLILVREFFEH